jgi:hypothetical protein
MTKYSVVSIPTDLFLRLLQHLQVAGSPPVDPDTAVAEAIEQWLAGQRPAESVDGMWTDEYMRDLHQEYERDVERERAEQLRGYTWKGLWLQNGTELRMRYKGKTFYAQVRGDDLVYDGVPSSPAQMVNTITGTNRNAWRDLWIKTPDDKEFVPAEQARDRSRERALDLIAKHSLKSKPADDTPQAAPSNSNTETASQGIGRP